MSSGTAVVVVGQAAKPSAQSSATTKRPVPTAKCLASLLRERGPSSNGERKDPPSSCNEVRFTTKCLAVLRDLFRSLDSDNDRFLSYGELANMFKGMSSPER